MEGFADPWEHVRLLSDAGRNEALIELLRRRAPGARVLEVGCGTGLLSCIAARLEARQVIAVEPTPLWEDAAELVRRNGLQDVVTVLQGRVQDVAPRPVDLAFSELLNADPYFEGVLEASDAAADWLAEGGRLAPRRLRVHVAAARAGDSAGEARSARAQVRALGHAWDLDVLSLLASLEPQTAYRYQTLADEPVGPSVLVHDVALGTGQRPPARRRVALPIEEPGPVGGALVWFEAVLDDGLVLHNAPGQRDHWGRMICAWPAEIGGASDGEVEVEVSLAEGELDVLPV